MPAAACDEPLPAYVVAGLGGFVGRESSGRLEDRRLAPSAWIGGGYRASRFLSFEVPFEVDSRRYSTRTVSPQAYEVLDDRMSLTTLWVPATLRVTLAIGAFVPYVGGGFELGVSKLTVEGTTQPTVAFPVSLPSSRSTTIVSPGFQWSAGVQWNIVRSWAAAVEYRRHYAEADFRGLSGQGSADIGGDAVAVRVLYSWSLASDDGS